MPQARRFTGTEFEEEICESKGWTRESVSPHIIWSGEGRTNFQKMKSINFDASKFNLTDDSSFDKWDATLGNRRFEIKKYPEYYFNNWLLYSEPFFKVATRDGLKSLIKIIGSDEDGAREIYNKFVNDFYERLMKEDIGKMILSKISESNHGIQCEDEFIPRRDLMFRYSINTSGWKGFNRINIEVKKRT